MLPRQCITYLEQNHCQLNAQAIKELKAHYVRPCDRSNNVQLEAFPRRLDQEQEQLVVDGVIITTEDKFNHYLQSGRLQQRNILHGDYHTVDREEPHPADIPNRSHVF